MTNKDTDFYKQLAADLIRKFLVVVGLKLVHSGWLNSEQTETLTSLESVQYLVGALFFCGSLLWMIAKQKYNVNVVREARNAPVDTPIEVIKTETLSKHKLISSV